jgi:nicotinate-nucleotide--dimethylbenzimidazole phosphoribosyltransferase
MSGTPEGTKILDALRRGVFDELIPPLDVAAVERARARQAILTKPPGSLGRLEDIAVFCAGVWGVDPSGVEPYATAVIFAADHGVAARGVSAYPQEVTRQMVYNFARGGAAANALSGACGAELVVVDVGVKGPRFEPPIVDARVAEGSRDMTEGPALRREEAERSILVGIEQARAAVERALRREKKFVLAAVGEMGIANTTPASAIVSVVTGRPPVEVTGSGTGLDEAGRLRKAQIVEEAIRRNRPDPDDPLDVLHKVGGLEIGAICGFCLGCAMFRVPLILDGFITAAGALLAKLFAPSAAQYWLGGHKSVERGHSAALDYLAIAPLLDLEMRLGEASGALVAMGVVHAALKAHSEMATFEEAGVSTQDSGREDRHATAAGRDSRGLLAETEQATLLPQRRRGRSDPPHQDGWVETGQ